MASPEPRSITVLQACWNAHTALRDANITDDNDYAFKSFMRTAASVLGTANADRLLDALRDTGESVEECLRLVLDIPQCHVALLDAPGQDTKVVKVFANINDAYDWLQQDHNGTVYTQAAEYVAATPDLLTGIDLDMLAWDISDAIAKTIDDHHIDAGMGAIKLALPAFLAAVIANAAAED